MRISWLVILALVGGGGETKADEEGKGRRLYLFFSEKTRSAPEAIKAALAFLERGKGEITFRPALLIEDWNTFSKVTETSPLYLTMRLLGKTAPVQVYDEEGLKLAQAWKISRLPAWVLVSQGKAHVLQGSIADLDQLARCSR